MNMEVCERSSIVVCVTTIGIYKDVWDVVRYWHEELRCKREPDTNRSNACMQSPLRDGIIMYWSSAV